MNPGVLSSSRFRELPTQKVDIFPKKDELRSDGDTCYHGEPEMLVSICLGKNRSVSSNTSTGHSSTDEFCFHGSKLNEI